MKDSARRAMFAKRNHGSSTIHESDILKGVQNKARKDVNSHKGTPRFQQLQKMVDEFHRGQRMDFASRSIKAIPKGKDVVTAKQTLHNLGYSNKEIKDAILTAGMHGVHFDKTGLRIR